MIGVDYELFWSLTPKTLQPFIKAFDLKRKYDDTLNWQLGGYIRDAIGSSLNSKGKYPNKPYSMMNKNGEADMHEIKSKFLNQMELINSKFKG